MHSLSVIFSILLLFRKSCNSHKSINFQTKCPPTRMTSKHDAHPFNFKKNIFNQPFAHTRYEQLLTNFNFTVSLVFNFTGILSLTTLNIQFPQFYHFVQISRPGREKCAAGVHRTPGIHVLPKYLKCAKCRKKDL